MWLQLKKIHQVQRSYRIAEELSNLIVYCRPVPFEGDKGNDKKDPLLTIMSRWTLNTFECDVMC